ncbi:MAG: PLP-dependent aminotransferase family protein [Colwellia sp.]|nr:PLP-dependent aminotransferase family protein [Colwellia sp.]
MKTLNLTIEALSKKLYLNIAEAIKTAIKNGNVKPLEKLPSARLLAEQLDVNRHTIMAAYNELIAQGWVETKQRRGYTVASALPIYSAITNKKSTKTTTTQHKWRIIKPNEAKAQLPASHYQYNFAGGNPDINIFPFNEFRGYINDALNRPAIKDLNYGDNAGYPPFIKEVATYLRRVRSITDKEIIVVNGTQEALYLVAQVLLCQGDKVAVESLGYRPAWKAFENAGAKLIGIKQTAQGIDVEHLETMFKANEIRLLYLTPLHQYPTTTTLPVAERIKIYRLAQHYNIPIIEDDYDHEFHYDSQPLAPMAANDPSGLVIYLSSFSKLMFPGIRLGIIAIDKSLSSHIINYRTIINHKANVLLQDAVARWMKDGAFERHLRKATRIYQQRRQCMVNVLNGFKDEGYNIEFTIPPGGMALWVNVGENAQQISLLARNEGIFLLAENSFHLNHENDEDQYIRLGFSGQSEEKIQQGLALLKSLLNKIS